MKTYFKKAKALVYPKEVLKTATLRQSGITFFGTFVNGLLGSLFFILTARFLGPSAFGLFSLTVTILVLVSSIGNLGVNTGLVNFVSKYRNSNRLRAFRFLKLGLKIKFVVSISLAVLGWYLAPLLSASVFKKTDHLVIPIRIGLLGIASLMSFSFITHALMAYQKYWQWSIVHVMTNFLRVVVIVLLYILGTLKIENAILVYSLIPFLGFIAGLLFIPNFLTVKNENSVSKEFFGYNKWVAAFTLVAAVSAKLDIFITARLLPSAQLGVYSAAKQLVQIVPQIASAISTVIGPKMASMTDKESFVRYLKKTQLMVAGMTFLGLLLIPVVLIVIPFLYGSEYVGVNSVFIILFLAMLVFLISIPLHQAIFYYYSKPRLFFWLSILYFVIISTVGWGLTAKIGVRGAAIGVLIAQTTHLVIPAIWVYKKIKEQ